MVNFTVRCKKALIHKNVPPESWGKRMRRRGQLKDDVDQIVYIRGECQSIRIINSSFQATTTSDQTPLVYRENSCHKVVVQTLEFGPGEMERHLFTGFHMCHVLGP